MIANAKGLESNDKRTGALSDMLTDAILDSNVRCWEGSFYWFNGKSYQEVADKTLSSAMHSALKRKSVNSEDRAVRGNTMIKYAMDICRADSILTPEGRDIICFQNTILDVNDMDMADHSPDFHVLSQMTYDYDPSAECPTWMSFMKEVLPIESVRNTLQEFLGAIFIDRKKAKIEQMCLLIGGGANGKGVVYSTICDIVGSANMEHFDINNLSTNKAHEYNIDAINGKLLNYCSDLAKQNITGEGFKNLVSGEELPARKIYGEPYTATDIPLMMANSNSMPSTVDQTYGYYRRWLPIPFDISIRGKNQDKTLPAKMKAELSGIFNWILEGRDRYIARGYHFEDSDEILAQIDSYMNNTDNVLQFLNESNYSAYPVYDGHISEFMGVSELYKAYTIWIPSAGKGAFSKTEFNDKLKQKCYVKKHTNKGDGWCVFSRPSEEDYDRLYAMGKTGMSRADFNKAISSRTAPDVEEGIEKPIPVPPKQQELPLRDYSEPFDPSNPLGMPADPE